MDVLGRKVAAVLLTEKDEGNFTYQMDLTHLVTGVYLVQVVDSDQQYAKRFVKRS